MDPLPAVSTSWISRSFRSSSSPRSPIVKTLTRGHKSATARYDVEFGVSQFDDPFDFQRLEVRFHGNLLCRKETVPLHSRRSRKESGFRMCLMSQCNGYRDPDQKVQPVGTRDGR